MKTYAANRKNRRDDQGFTLVEMIVVLVIMAVLAAAIVPSLTGYINRANEEKAISETRSLVMAAQTVVAQAYADGTVGLLASSGDEVNTKAIAEIRSLAGFPQEGNTADKHFALTISGEGNVVSLEYQYSSTESCFYDGEALTYTSGKAHVEELNGEDLILNADNVIS